MVEEDGRVFAKGCRAGNLSCIVLYQASRVDDRDVNESNKYFETIILSSELKKNRSGWFNLAATDLVVGRE